MSGPAPSLFEAGTTTQLAAHAFGTVPAPGTSSEWLFDYANVGNLSQTLNGVAVRMLESDDEGATWQSAGTAALRGWFEVQAYDVAIDATGNTIESQVTGWQAIGAGRRLKLKPIPGGTRRKLKARLHPGVSAFSSIGKLFMLVADYDEPASYLLGGFFAAGAHGIVSGAADQLYFGLISGGTPAATGTPDNYLQITDTTIVRAAGVPAAKYAHQISMAASGSGNARWVTVVWDGVTSSFDLIETAEVTAPAAISTRPAVPDGTVLIADVHRDDGTIASGDIYTDRRTLRPFGLSVVSGLNITVGPGDAIADDWLVSTDASIPGALADNAENFVYVTRAGGLYIGAAPDRAEPLWALTTLAGAITKTRDLRRWLVRGGLVPAEFRFDAEPTGGDYRYWHAPFESGVMLHVPEGLSLSVGSMGDRTTGNLVLDLEWFDAVTAHDWVPCFSDNAKRPTIAATATEDDLRAHGFIPDTLVFPAGCRFRCTLATKPTGGTVGPTGVVMRALFELANF